MNVIMDDSTFDMMLLTSLPDVGEASEVSLVTKDGVVGDSEPVVMLTFLVAIPGGTTARVQSTTSVRQFLQMARLVEARYGYLL